MLDELIARASALATTGDRRILGITGPPGAGKSTLAEKIVATLGPDEAVLVPMDGFHLAKEVLDRRGSRGRKGAPDTFDVDGYVALLTRLRDRTPVFAPRFDRDIEESIGSAIEVRPEVPLVVTEGNYVLLQSDSWRGVRAAPRRELVRRHPRRRSARLAGRSPPADRTSTTNVRALDRHPSHLTPSYLTPSAT